MSHPLIPLRQQITAVAAAALLTLVIVDLVRRKRLREEYAWLWTTIALVGLALSVRVNWLIDVTRLIGAQVSSSGFYFLSILFLTLLCLHFSVKASEMSSRLQVLAQKYALLEAELSERLGR